MILLTIKLIKNNKSKINKYCSFEIQSDSL